MKYDEPKLAEEQPQLKSLHDFTRNLASRLDDLSGSILSKVRSIYDQRGFSGPGIPEECVKAEEDAITLIRRNLDTIQKSVYILEEVEGRLMGIVGDKVMTR